MQRPAKIEGTDPRRDSTLASLSVAQGQFATEPQNAEQHSAKRILYELSLRREEPRVLAVKAQHQTYSVLRGQRCPEDCVRTVLASAHSREYVAPSLSSTQCHSNIIWHRADVIACLQMNLVNKD